MHRFAFASFELDRVNLEAFNGGIKWLGNSIGIMDGPGESNHYCVTFKKYLPIVFWTSWVHKLAFISFEIWNLVIMAALNCGSEWFVTGLALQDSMWT